MVALEFTTIRDRCVVGHSDIQDAMNAIGMKKDWLRYINGQTTQCIDESQPFDDLNLDNDGVYIDDLERFCRFRNIKVTLTRDDN